MHSFDVARASRETRYTFRIIAIPIPPAVDSSHPSSPLVDYARRTKLFFSSMGRDYRLLAAKAPRNPYGNKKGSQATRDSTR